MHSHFRFHHFSVLCYFIWKIVNLLLDSISFVKNAMYRLSVKLRLLYEFDRPELRPYLYIFQFGTRIARFNVRISWGCQCDNQKPPIEGQITQWQKDKQWSMELTNQIILKKIVSLLPPLPPSMNKKMRMLIVWKFKVAKDKTRKNDQPFCLGFKFFIDFYFVRIVLLLLLLHVQPISTILNKN
jgi:hypothetical protein